MATLLEDIRSQSEWIIRAFAADGFKLDYTIDSIIEIDRFFSKNMKNGQPRKRGRLYGKGYGPILFSIGAYVGETIIHNVKGSQWITDDNDPQGELKVSLKLPDGTELAYTESHEKIPKWQRRRYISLCPHGNKNLYRFAI